jgi:dipeptidyl aminopeptidase/acylaminoacyl peptidase
LLAAVVAAAWTSCALAQSPSTLEQDAKVFGLQEAVFSADLSPDGRRAVFVGGGPGRTSIVHVADITAGTTKPILYSKGDETIRWCDFASNDRLVCRYTAMIVSAGGYAAVGVPIPISRTISLAFDGSDIKSLGQTSSSYDLGIRQYDGDVIDWLPDSQSDVLMTRLFLPEGFRDNPSNIARTKRGVGVVRLNVKTLSATTVEAPRDSVSDWFSDGRGHVRLLGLWEVSGETYQTGRIKYLYRTPNSRDWKALTDFVDLRDFQPLGVDAVTNSLYSVRRYQGTDALTRIALDETRSETVLAHSDKVNVDRLQRLGESRRVVGYGYREDPDHIVYLDPEYKSLSTALSSALPGKPIITFVSESENGKKLLLFAGNNNDPGRYYLFDRATKALGELVPVRPDLIGRAAPTRSVSFAAPDGTQIDAQVTLPPGRSAKALPTVVLADGSRLRDSGGFQWLAQFLAVRGYAVIEPLYRGYDGEDKWFREKGYSGWSTSVSDLSAAAHFLTKEGIADGQRLAILGRLEGGHVALMAAAMDPAIYRAVVAIAPITDLSSYKADWSDYTAGNRVRKLIGDAELDASPVRRASSIQAPVLLVQGTVDAAVRNTQSREMDEALRKAGKQSELLEFAGLDNQLRDSDARRTMLLKIGQLLDRTIGH